MQTSEDMLRRIEAWEGLRTHSYQDSVGVWTIGIGCTGDNIGPGMVITEAQARAMFADRLSQEFEPAVEQAVGDAPTTQGQFDAMVSLAFNIGVGGLLHSSILAHHIAGEYQEAADSFLKWNKAGGQILAGLDKRRWEEGTIYLNASPE